MQQIVPFFQFQLLYMYQKIDSHTVKIQCTSHDIVHACTCTCSCTCILYSIVYMYTYIKDTPIYSDIYRKIINSSHYKYLESCINNLLHFLLCVTIILVVGVVTGRRAVTSFVGLTDLGQQPTSFSTCVMLECEVST